MILNVDSAEEVMELLGIYIEYFNIKIHPVMHMEKMQELFDKYLVFQNDCARAWFSGY